MAHEYSAAIGEFRAGAAISQFRLVKLDSSTPKKLIVTAAATDIPFGTLQQSSTADGDVVTTVVAGRTKAVASAAIAAGAILQPAAAGKVATHATTNARIGRALQAALADGDIIDVLIFDNPFAGDLS
jgi:hypothetical protein